MSMFPWFSMERASLKHHSISNTADGDALMPLLTDHRLRLDGGI